MKCPFIHLHFERNAALTALFFLMLLPLARANPVMTQFYVDPVAGSDSYSGLAQYPFQTIQRAQQAVRATNSAMTGDIVVYLRGGIYQLTNTLNFTTADSGTSGYNVRYSAYPSEVPIISGGQVISNWNSMGGGLYEAQVLSGMQFRQLYVNGNRCVRARTPNDGCYARLAGWDTNNQLINFPLTNFPSFTSDPGNPAEIAIQVRWALWRGRIASITTNGTIVSITLMQPERSIIFNNPNQPKYGDEPFFLDNAYNFLDQPGEWYFQASTGSLFYKPRAGENMVTAQVVAPAVTTLVNITGLNLSSPIKNLQFNGIVFQDSNWLVPNTYGHVDYQANQFNTMLVNDSNLTFYHTEAAVMLSMAQRIEISDCTFQNLGAVGVDLGTACVSNVVNGNLFNSLADNAINDAAPAIASPNPSDLRTVNHGNLFANNFITDIGLDYQGAVGVFIGYAHNETVQHNEIYNVPYSGISDGWGWSFSSSVASNNVIQNNRIMRYDAALADGGGIYTLSAQPGSVIQSNYIQDAWYNSYAQHVPIVPVYLDEGSSGIVVQNNVWTNAGRDFINGTIQQHIDDGNNFANNGSQDPNIVTNSGIMPQYQAIRPWPIPNHAPGDFQNSLTLALSYATNYSIYYTTNGAVPTTNSPLYNAPIQLGQTLPLAAIAVNSVGGSSGVFQGNYRLVSEVTEGMPTNTWYEIVVGSQEMVGQADDTGFPWGGYTPVTANGAIDSTLDPIGRLYFFDGGSSYSMVTPGAYVYTIFSSNGNSVATTNVVGMNQGGAIKITANDELNIPLGFRFLIRDRNDNWYLSSTNNELIIPGGGTFSIDPTKQTWQKVNSSALFSMNSIYAGRVSSGPGSITPNANAASPDLSQVTGGGLYIDQVPAGTAQLNYNCWWLYSISWIGTSSSIPSVVTPASAVPNPVSGTNTSLSVMGADNAGEANLTYTWSTTGATPSAVTFSANGNNAAKSAVATFSAAGTYGFQVVIANQLGLSVTSSVVVEVSPSPTSLLVSPSSAIIGLNGTQQFTAVVNDQFANPLATQPLFAWSVSSGGGSINSSGLFTAPATTGTSVVQAVADVLTNLASVSVINVGSTPAVPGGLVAVGGDSRAALIWNPAAGATGYNVKRAISSPGSYSLIVSNLTKVSYTDTGLVNGSNYYYVVSAVNAAGESSNSAPTGVTPEPAVVSTSAPLAWLTFNNTLVDQSGGQHNGTFVGSATYTTNVPEVSAGSAALSLPDVGASVSVANPTNLILNTGSPFTMACWFQLTGSAASYPTMVMKQPASGWDCSTYNRGGFMIVPTGKLHFDVSCIGGVDSQMAVNDGYWHHGAVVYNGTSYQLYVDGQPDGQGTFAACNEGVNHEPPWVMNVGYGFNGRLDEFGFWNTALSANQVSTVMTQGPGTLAERPMLGIVNSGGQVILSWNNPAFHLQVNPNLSQGNGWTNVLNGTNSPVVSTVGSTPAYFRLTSP